MGRGLKNYRVTGDGRCDICETVIALPPTVGLLQIQKRIERKPVEEYNSTAGDCQANCETRKSNADDNGS